MPIVSDQNPDTATLQIQPYAYTALDRGVGDIRLLHLLPAASPTHAVYCHLSHAPLEDTTTTIYEALSYTWGKGGRTETIYLDDQVFAVTENLREALLALRDPHSTRVLWIDAICINQDDVEERAHEVVRMLRIYQLASRVVVWLGSSSDNSELAIQHFHELDLEWRSNRDPAVRATLNRFVHDAFVKAVGCIMGFALALRHRYLISSWNILFLMGWLPFGKSGITRLLVRWISCCTLFEMAVTIWGGYLSLSTDLAYPKGQPSPETVQALAAFHNRSWFRRAWIIQEIAAARDLIMVCGSQQMHVLLFFNATHAIDSRMSNTAVRSTYVDSGYMRGGALRVVVNRAAIGSLCRMGGGHIGTSLTDAERLLILLQKFRKADATDERDKVYAILGLCSFDPLGTENEDRAKSPVVVPSYTQPAWHVYASLVRVLVVGTNGSLDVLRHCEGFKEVPGLPSWAPDWTCRNVTVPFSTVLTLKAMSFDSLPSPQLPLASFSDDMRIMSVRGFLIGVIVDASEVVISRASVSQPPRTTAQHDSAAATECATTPMLPSDEPTWVLASDRVPSFAGYAIRCFFAIISWIMDSGVVTMSMGILIKGIQLFVYMFPRRAGRGVNFALEVLEDSHNLMKEFAIEMRLTEQMWLDNQKRARRMLEQGSTRNASSVFEKYHNEDIDGRTPLSLENTLVLMQPAPDGEGDGDSILRTVVWQSDLEDTILSDANFGTSCRDPRTGDLVALFVGSRDAHIIRFDEEDNLFTLVGLADLGMAVRWMWRDAVKEFDARKRELHTIRMK